MSSIKEIKSIIGKGNVKFTVKGITHHRRGGEDNEWGEFPKTFRVNEEAEEKINELLSQHVCVDIRFRTGKQLNNALDPVDEDDDVVCCLALQFDGVPACELQIGAEVSSGIGVNNAVGQWREADNNRFPRAGNWYCH